MASGAGTCDTVVMDIGRVGIWTFSLELQPAARAQEAASEIESLGYRALWIPEALGREAFTHAGLLLAGTRRLIVATGIANIWARDAMTMAAGEKTLDEAYPGRFLLGIGVSHAPLVEAVRGHRYEKPLSFMRRYLDAMDAAPYLAAPPSTPTRRVIGALAPKMLALAAERTAGAHPYFVPPGAHGPSPGDHGTGVAAGTRAGAGAGDRSDEGARDRPHAHGHLSRPAQLPPQSPLARLR